MYPEHKEGSPLRLPHALLHPSTWDSEHCSCRSAFRPGSIHGQLQLDCQLGKHLLQGDQCYGLGFLDFFDFDDFFDDLTSEPGAAASESEAVAEAARFRFLSFLPFFADLDDFFGVSETTADASSSSASLESASWHSNDTRPCDSTTLHTPHCQLQPVVEG